METIFENLGGTYRQQGDYLLPDIEVDELLTNYRKQGGADIDKIAEQLKAYIDKHPFDPGDSDCETVLDQLYQAYAESHEAPIKTAISPITGSKRPQQPLRWGGRCHVPPSIGGR